jgi:hypothetical protein
LAAIGTYTKFFTDSFIVCTAINRGLYLAVGDAFANTDIHVQNPLNDDVLNLNRNENDCQLLLSGEAKLNI